MTPSTLKRGDISITTAVVGAVGMVIASGFAAWASSNQAVFDVRTQVVQVTERENNHYLEVKSTLDRIEKKIDTIPSIRNAAAAGAALTQ